jgi:hypothetical protein
VTFLLCRALDGCEDLSESFEEAIHGLHCTVPYLQGVSEALPDFSRAAQMEVGLKERARGKVPEFEGNCDGVLGVAGNVQRIDKVQWGFLSNGTFRYGI